MAETYSAKPSSVLFAQIIHGGKIAAPTSVLFGFVADVLTPLAPLNGILFITSAFFVLLMGYLYRRKCIRGECDFSKKIPEQGLVFGLFLLLGFGLWFVLQLVAGNDRGVTASHVRMLATLQDTLLGIKKDIGEVRQGITTVKADTDAIKKTLDGVQQSVEGIGRGGIFQNPDSPAEFYHNAKIYELDGKYDKAFGAYRQYADSGNEFIDPYIAYVGLLEAQKGDRNAADEISRLRKKFPGNRCILLAELMRLPLPERRTALSALAETNSDFGPALVMAADSFSVAMSGKQSKIEAEREQEFLKAFIAADDAGNVLPFYLDKRKAIELVGGTRARLNKSVQENDSVRARLLVDRLDVEINDVLVETVFFKLDNEEWQQVPTIWKWEVINTTLARLPKDDALAYRAARLLENSDGTIVVSIKYTDVNGGQSRVIEFEPEKLVEFGRTWVDLNETIENARNVTEGLRKSN